MASSVKACTNSRYRKTNIVIITILSLLSCFALVMVIYNLIKGSYLFSIAWFIATILASTYAVSYTHLDVYKRQELMKSKPWTEKDRLLPKIWQS